MTPSYDPRHLSMPYRPSGQTSPPGQTTRLQSAHAHEPLPCFAANRADDETMTSTACIYCGPFVTHSAWMESRSGRQRFTAGDMRARYPPSLVGIAQRANAARPRTPSNQRCPSNHRDRSYP